MPETIEFSRIGKSDLHLGPEPFEVRLADGRVYTMPAVDIGYFYGDACARAELSAADPTGQLKRLTDVNRGLWRHAGGGHWYDIGGQHYNVQAFGARGNAAADDTAAIQDAIDTCAAAGGGVVYFPPGTYLTTAQLTINADSVYLEGPGRGAGDTPLAQLRAHAAMTNMVAFDAASLKQRGGVHNLTLDGHGLADWCIMVDGWRGLVIDNNLAFDALIGFMHTDFSGHSDFALSRISHNRAAISQTTLAGGQGMAYFFKGDRANGQTCDPIQLFNNEHTGFGRGANAASWSIWLNSALRCWIDNHYASPFETGTFDGIVAITNSGSGGNSGRHVITNLSSEWGSQTQPCILIDADSSSASDEIVDCRILYPQCQPNNPVVKLDTSGSGFVRGTLIAYPRRSLTASDTIVVNDAGCVATTILARSTTGSVLDAQITDNGLRTVINGVWTDALDGQPPSAGDFDVGTFAYDSDRHFWYGQGHDGAVSPLTAGGLTQLSGWIVHSDTAVQFADFFTPRQVVAVTLNVTEAFNAGTTATLKAGTSAGGSNIFAAVDVTTTGMKTVTLGSAAYASSAGCHLTYAETGSASSSGKALVVFHYALVESEPA
jgi:Pectate lyase superfamily protein